MALLTLSNISYEYHLQKDSVQLKSVNGMPKKFMQVEETYLIYSIPTSDHFWINLCQKIAVE